MIIYDLEPNERKEMSDGRTYVHAAPAVPNIVGTRPREARSASSLPSLPSSFLSLDGILAPAQANHELECFRFSAPPGAGVGAMASVVLVDPFTVETSKSTIPVCTLLHA